MNTLARFLSRHPVVFFGVLIVYVFSPLDIIPEAFTGVIGYIDDILLVAAALLLRRYGQRSKNNAPPHHIDTTAE